MKKVLNKYKGGLMLLITALIWGVAFLFQKNSMDSCTNMVETAQMILLLQAD